MFVAESCYQTGLNIMTEWSYGLLLADTVNFLLLHHRLSSPPCKQQQSEPIASVASTQNAYQKEEDPPEETPYVHTASTGL